MRHRYRIAVRGIVQGIGFRPFVHRLASAIGLAGSVRNTSSGVEIDIEGERGRLQSFLRRLERERPPAARIEAIVCREVPASGAKGFVIRPSAIKRGFTQLAPDLALCPDCLREFRCESDRRYRYVFINCTNCGPRYSIIHDTPYDRDRTSMRRFKMCAACAAEFASVTDRRFHAQPNCCPACGPSLRLTTISGRRVPGDPVAQTIALLRNGALVAIKGIGGFHIAADATNNEAVRRLRLLKQRPTKPLAVMTAGDRVRDIARVSADELAAMRSPAAPIVLLRKRPSRLSPAVAPGNPYVGVMLPYAPLHYLLLDKIPYLVMTSANRHDEPLVAHDSEVKRLASIVSFVLGHDRPIANRCDDSVGCYEPRTGFAILRRSRGYAPVPVTLPIRVRPTLALGPYLKNTFTLARGTAAYVSPHIGDLDNERTLDLFQELLEKYQRWFKIKPERIVHDLHPDYLTTHLARAMKGEKIAVQHHAAHFAACLAENAYPGPALGMIFDGTGYGTDGAIWGCEFLVGDIRRHRRVAHLEYLALPGGEASIRNPYRIALAYLRQLAPERATPRVLRRLFPRHYHEQEQIDALLASSQDRVVTSSLGRMFDCVSALLGVTETITYEGEAAINLEHHAACATSTGYRYAITESEPGACVIRMGPTLHGILDDLERGVSTRTIAARFHETVTRFALDIADRTRRLTDVTTIALSGGVFQNRRLQSRLVQRLHRAGFRVLLHRQLPANDGCISYGQVVLAGRRPAGC